MATAARAVAEVPVAQVARVAAGGLVVEAVTVDAAVTGAPAVLAGPAGRAVNLAWEVNRGNRVSRASPGSRVSRVSLVAPADFGNAALGAGGFVGSGEPGGLAGADGEAGSIV